MPEAKPAYLTAVVEAATHASGEIDLADTSVYFTAEVSFAPIVEELAQVAVKHLSCEEVVVQLTPLLETQSVDMTAAAKAATQASDEIALAVTAVTSARLRLLRLQPRWNSRKQQRTLSSVRNQTTPWCGEGLQRSCWRTPPDASLALISRMPPGSRLRCRRGNRKSRGLYSAIGAACGAGVAIADLTLLCRWYYYFWELIVSDNLFIQPLMTANSGSLHKFGIPEC